MKKNQGKIPNFVKSMDMSNTQQINTTNEQLNTMDGRNNTINDRYNKSKHIDFVSQNQVFESVADRVS